MNQEKKLLALLDDAMAIIRQQQREAELWEQRHQIELLILKARLLQVQQPDNIFALDFLSAHPWAGRFAAADWHAPALAALLKTND